MFEYIERGHNRTLVLLPGWASDQRIFARLDLRFNYLLMTGLYGHDFNTELLAALRKQNIQQTAMLGFSLGAFKAAEFATAYPDLIDGLILAGVRKQYDAAKLAIIKKQLKKNKKAFLYKFYQDCFFYPAEISWFKNNLLKSYCEKFSVKYLQRTLDYLAMARIEVARLKSIQNIKIIHGADDRIAPCGEAKAIAKSLPQAEFLVIEGSGHIPFLREEFSELLKDRRGSFF